MYVEEGRKEGRKEGSVVVIKRVHCFEIMEWMLVT